MALSCRSGVLTLSAMAALIVGASRGAAQSVVLPPMSAAGTQGTSSDPSASTGSVARSPTEIVQQPTPIADELARNIRVLAAEPRNVPALIAAASAALRLGDESAAFAFFSRAEAIDPRNGAVKAGLGSAFLATERPAEALRLFGEAKALGAPEGAFAADRGLAYDLTGDPRRAQQDYALALRAGPNDETIRRYALSLGISGDRAGAMALIDPMLRRQDFGAWRVRAFVLAMTGDVQGAQTISRSVMPPAAASAMAPFFARLAGLSPAQRAMAVHLGQLPANGARYAAIEPGNGMDPATAAYRQRQLPIQTDEPAVAVAPGSVTPRAPVSREPRRRPGSTRRQNASAVEQAPGQTVSGQTLAGQPGSRVTRAPAENADTAQPGSPAAVTRARVNSGFGGGKSAAQLEREGRQRQGVSRAPVAVQTTPTPAPAPAPVAVAPAPAPAPVVVQATPRPAPIMVEPVPAPTPAPGTESPAIAAATPSSSGVAPAPVQVAPVQVAPVQPAPSVSGTELAGPRPIQGLPIQGPLVGQSPAVPSNQPQAATPQVQDRPAVDPGRPVATAPKPVVPKAEAPKPKPTPTPTPTAKPTPVPTPKTKAPAEVAKAKKKVAAKPAHPARHWVQVAGGANKAGLPVEWARLRKAEPALFAGQSAWTTPLRATNRLLVGPFASDDAAQVFVNRLKKAGVSGFAVDSIEGQVVEKLSAK